MLHVFACCGPEKQLVGFSSTLAVLWRRVLTVMLPVFACFGTRKATCWFLQHFGVLWLFEERAGLVLRG